MAKRKIGIGTLSLLMSMLGIAWNATIYGFNLGGTVLNFFGLNAWSRGAYGVHLTIFYSLIFFIPAYLFAVKHKTDFGAKAGKIISTIMIIILLVLTPFGLLAV